MLSDQVSPPVDYPEQLDADIVRLARMALEAGAPEAQPLLRRLARRHREDRPRLASGIVALLRESPLRGAALKRVSEGQPVDIDSRTPLVREESYPSVALAPILPKEVRSQIELVVEEHQKVDKLALSGLAPTRTGIFVGPPGVGKTLAARWIASQLGVPLMTLDLSSVMSSFLGKTGDNLRRVIEYAKTKKCVLLLDELDAVAKRRDDASEVGELKRLVTVLLQEVDYWPQGSLLLAASNHEELLDPAVWRRFEVTVRFPLPSGPALYEAIGKYVGDDSLSEWMREILAAALEGSSFSRVEQEVGIMRRRAALSGLSLDDQVLERLKSKSEDLKSAERIALALKLVTSSGISQRRIQEITGVSRDTLRRRLQGSSDSERKASDA